MLFQTGETVATRAVHEKMQEEPSFCEFVLSCIHLHRSGIWGDLSKADMHRNDDAVKDGSRIFSAYIYRNGDNSKKIWIITEADRSSTTILFPEDY